MKHLEKLPIVFVVLFIFTVCGAVQIDNCNNGETYITDDTSNPTGIICSGLSLNDVVEWNAAQSGLKTVFATCSGAVCTNQVSYVNAVRDQVSGTSTLTYVNNIRRNAEGASVYCNSANCVIRVADALPTVTVDVDGGTTYFIVGDTATLRCSTSRSPPSPLPYTYTWNINCDVQQSGNVCQFTVKSEHNGRQVSCTVTYTQNPYIAGKTASVTINVIATTPRASPSTTRSNSGPSTTAAPGTTSTRTTESNSHGPSTNAISGTARSSKASGTTAGSSQPSPSAGALESMSEGNSDDQSFAAIIGGVIGTVIAAIIVVIIAVFLIKRRKNQPKSAPHQKRSPRDEDDCEEHVNPIYGTEDPNSKGKVAEDDVEDVGYAAVGPTHQPHTTHTAIYEPVHTSSANGAGRRTAPDQREENLYNSVDGDDLQAANKGRRLHNTYQAGPSHVVAAETSQEYAVVDMSGSSQVHAANPSEDVYAVVNKNKSKQISQPKPALKPKSQSQSAEEPVDDYKKLNFHPSTNLARDPDSPEQLYNHLS